MWTSLFTRSRNLSATNFICCLLMRAASRPRDAAWVRICFRLRDYQPQDDLRHIDWKATARSRNLTVREFTAEDERRITIVLDTRDLTETDRNEFLPRFEAGVVQAASLLKHFIDERAEVRLVLGDDPGTLRKRAETSLRLPAPACSGHPEFPKGNAELAAAPRTPRFQRRQQV